MNAEEYLSQAHRLDQKINSDLKELSDLRAMACSVSSPGWEERIRASGPKEAPFVKNVEKIILLENKINQEIDLFVDLKEQIRDTINGVEDADEQLVLRYRHLHGYTWDAIGLELHVDAKTAKRWYDNALEHMQLPVNPINIFKNAGNVLLCPEMPDNIM
ncbi:MAG TPA: RNA polymerase subunit sigma-70 [Clostridiales bacterium]|jgi:TPR repeat protein|nr:RNA polymerase subunit sigma-70 [Clostridiales bacterium]